MSGRDEGIEVAWIGTSPGDPGLLGAVSARLAEEFGVPVRDRALPERPGDAFDLRRGQHRSTSILGWLAERRAADGWRILGLTDVDLFIPILTFVFGEAQLGGGAAVVSTARLGHDGTEFHDPRRLAARLLREAVHEVGHCFGLLHCDRPACVMRRSAGLVEVDAKGPSLCVDCRAVYREIRHREGVLP